MTDVQQAVPVAQEVERLAKIYADATGYYVEFHRGLSSPSADKIREGITAVLAALTPDATQTREAELVAALREARLGFLALSGELDNETQLAWSKKHVAKIDDALNARGGA